MIEDISCYASPAQRAVLKLIAGAPALRPFFLTGGTCLAVFYLHHRVSHALDVFTTEPVDMSALIEPLRMLLRPQSVVASAPHFFSCVVEGVKLDFVVDPLSDRAPRPAVSLDGVSLAVDRLENIGPNKICALISRSAAKDAVDCYALYRESPERFMADYRIASGREALLDDLMYAGEKLYLLSEEASRRLEEIRQDLRIPLSADDFAAFYARLGERLFRAATA